MVHKFSLFPCDFIVKRTGVKLTRIETRHADHEANECKLCPPIIPEANCKQHGAAAKNKMHTHVNCLLRQLVIRSKHGIGVIAKERLELICSNSANEKRASEIDIGSVHKHARIESRRVKQKEYRS